MLIDTVNNFKEQNNINSFFSGFKLPADFELPSNILMFKHDWLPTKDEPHERYQLIIPAVPINFIIDGETSYQVSPGQAFFSYPCQHRNLLATYQDVLHGYPRLIITFTLSHPLYYLPDCQLLNFTDKAEEYLRLLIDSYLGNYSVDMSIQLFFLLRELSNNRVRISLPQHSRQIRDTLNYIGTNFGKHASIKNLALHAKSSISSLRNRFKAEVGISLGAYVRMKKLEIAKYYLSKTNMRIEEISDICGFRSIHTFSHFFKKYTQMSPSAWRHTGR